MKTIHVLGITLKDYTLGEELRMTEQFIKGGALKTVLYVSKQQLISASGDERLKRWLEEADLTICGDPDILSVVETPYKNRLWEIEHHEYLHEVFRKAVRGQMQIFLLADTADHLELMENSQMFKEGTLSVAGKGLLTEADAAEEETLINEINDVAPGMIVSWLPFEQFCGFAERNRMLMNAGMILALPEDGVQEIKARGVWKIIRYAYRKLFWHKVRKYNYREKTEQQRSGGHDFKSNLTEYGRGT